jgi:hypothetical protein
MTAANRDKNGSSDDVCVLQVKSSALSIDGASDKPGRRLPCAKRSADYSSRRLRTISVIVSGVQMAIASAPFKAIPVGNICRVPALQMGEVPSFHRTVGQS